MSQSTYLLLVILISVCGFLAGSILFAKILPRAICKVDIVAVSEDHNPGVSNVFKHCGVPVGLLTAVCDFAKAFFPILAADILIPMEVRTPLFALVIMAPVLGHIFSVFNRGNGGMGAAAMWATLMAVFLQCKLIVFLVIIYVVVRYICRVTEKQHLRTILCFGIFFVATLLFETIIIYRLAYLILSAVICLKCLYIALRQRNARAQET